MNKRKSKTLNELIKVESDHKSKLDDLQQSIIVLKKERNCYSKRKCASKSKIGGINSSGQTLAGFSNGAKNLVRATDNKRVNTRYQFF